VQFELLRQGKSFVGCKSIVKGPGCMNIQIILNKVDHFYRGIICFPKFFHKMRIVNSGTPHPHLDKSPALQRLKSKQNTTRAITFIFIILAFGSSWFRRHGRQHIADQLAGTFIKANDRTQGIIRFFIKRKGVFHMPDIVTSDFSDAPTFD
jgi:hypothetical protein